MKNLTVILLALTVAYAGYYMYASNKNSALMVDGENVSADGAIAKTQVFISRRMVLDGVKLDMTVFDDPVFNSYKSFSEPIYEKPIGRTNPFTRTSNSNRSNEL